MESKYLVLKGSPSFRLSVCISAVIVCGDFNENPDAKNIEQLLSDGDSNTILRNPYLNLFKTQQYSTYHYKSGLLFDQMLVSNHFFQHDYVLQYEDAKVFNHEKLAVWDQKFFGRPFRTFAGTRYLGGYSDHFPVYTKLSKL